MSKTKKDQMPTCWLILCTNNDGKTWWHPIQPLSTRGAAEFAIRCIKVTAVRLSALPKMKPVRMVEQCRQSH